MKALTPEAMGLLERICAVYAGQPFEEGKEEQFRPANLCRAEQKLALAELWRAGLLVARQKVRGERLYHIPAEQLHAVAEQFFPYLPEPLKAGEVRLTMEAGPGLVAELFRALLFIAREGLPLTAKGSIHKKNAARLAAQLSFGEQHLASLAEFTSGQGDCPLAVATVLDIMLSLGLVSQQATGYLLESETLKSWLYLPERKMTSLLYDTVAERYGSREPVLQHFRLLLSRPEFPPGQWNALPDVLDWLEKLDPASAFFREVAEAACLDWLRCLSGFGWAELGSLQNGTHCFRWTAAKPELALKLGSELQSHGSSSAAAVDQVPDAGFIVHQDFEVLVPPQVPYTLRWTLAACAELQQCDVLWSFRLTREMLEYASVQGMPAKDMISWLHDHTPGGLPEPVQFTLELWGNGIGRTSLTQVQLLSCLSEEEGEVIAAHPRLQDKLSRLGALHFLVPPEHEEEVRRELSTAGLAPQGTIGGRKQEKEQAGALPVFHQKTPEDAGTYAVPPWEQGLFSLTSPLRYLPLATPEPEEAFLPVETSVPPMWSREWRTYHATTAEKVMEQGLRWGVKVRLSLQGEGCYFIPSRIHRHPWRVSGNLMRTPEGEAEEVVLTSGEWKQMQLILPAAARNSSSAGATGYVMIRKSTADGRTLT